LRIPLRCPILRFYPDLDPLTVPKEQDLVGNTPPMLDAVFLGPVIDVHGFDVGDHISPSTASRALWPHKLS
jgi:hypothetical protein